MIKNKSFRNTYFKFYLNILYVRKISCNIANMEKNSSLIHG